MTMEYRTLELNIISAKDLKDVNQFTTMDVYAVVFVSGDPLHPQTATTHVDKDGGTNPTWNYPVKFTVNESLVQQNRLSLEVKLISDRILAGGTVIGNVHIPLKVLLGPLRQVSCMVIKPSGKAKGTLNFSYKFGERVVAYPPPGTAAGSSSVPYGTAYPPPQHATGYAYPPPPTAPQQGNGYPAGQKPQKKKNKLLDTIEDIFTEIVTFDTGSDTRSDDDGFDLYDIMYSVFLG